MRKILAIILCCIFLTSCGEDEEDKVASRANFVTHFDWNRDGVPLNDMVIAIEDCKTYPDLYECKKLRKQAADISIAFETCKQSQKSMMCDDVIKTIGNHPIKSLLPEAQALTLPNHPFYFLLPTTFLDEISNRYGYRSEMWGAWIQKYQLVFDWIIFGTTNILILWVWLTLYRKEKANQAKIERIKIAEEQDAAEKKLGDDELKKREEAIAVKQKITKEDIARIRQATQEKFARQQDRQREIQREKEEARLVEEMQKTAEVAQEKAREATEKKIIEDMMAAAVKNFAKKK